mgnify:FL=1
MAENTKQFFQITEAARACGLSRSTLMRMEERGLLTPVFTCLLYTSPSPRDA